MQETFTATTMATFCTHIHTYIQTMPLCNCPFVSSASFNCPRVFIFIYLFMYSFITYPHVYLLVSLYCQLTLSCHGPLSLYCNLLIGLAGDIGCGIYHLFGGRVCRRVTIENWPTMGHNIKRYWNFVITLCFMGKKEEVINSHLLWVDRKYYTYNHDSKWKT